MNNPLINDSNDYAEYVDHPRYGRRPHFTGLNANPLDPDVQLHWNTIEYRELVSRFEAATGHSWPFGEVSRYSNDGHRIEGTAIPADLTRQTRATVPVTHYFDLKRTCRDCARPFIFFAMEQKHWYEELGFGLESDCVRCAECRKRRHGIARLREMYETLYHVNDKTEEQCLQMADTCLSLIESGVFTKKQTQRARMLLNSAKTSADTVNDVRRAELMARIRLVERTSGESRGTDPSNG